MKKFSISKLEKARQNPTQFAKSLILSKQSDGHPRFSKYMAWQLSVYEYHKTKNLSQAIDYFERIFMRNFAENKKNERDRESFIMNLHSYAIDYSSLDLTYIEHKRRIELVLSPKVKITGEIPLINMNDRSGYSAYFFTKNSTTWETELRFPVIQNYLSDFYGVDLSNVEMGIYGIDTKKHSQTIYTNQDVSDAINELNSIGQVITNIL